LIAAAGIGCKSSSSDETEFPGKTQEQIVLLKRGKAIYQSVCIACHNPNPKLDGSLGPAVFGSSLELLETRILRAEYPAGYKPKRRTKLMTALPQYKGEIPAIFEYLKVEKP
jgi:mono/diheme cytochrome c family protein